MNNKIVWGILYSVEFKDNIILIILDMKKFSLLIVALFVLLESCKKDDSMGTPTLPPHGFYSFNGRSNIIIKKWIAGGVEVAPVDSDLTHIEEEGVQLYDGFKFHFGVNNNLSFVDSINNFSDTVKYKIINNSVYIYIGPNPYTNTSYVPYFIIDGSNLYINYQEVWYTDFFGGSGLGMPKLNNINLVDTALKEMGYTSLNQLKNQDRITYFTFRENFKHED